MNNVKQLNFLEIETKNETSCKAFDFEEISTKNQKILNTAGWKLFIDGAARGNPGPAGAGIYLEDENSIKIFEKCAYLKEKTNNQAEYFALALGAFFIKKELSKINHKPTSLTIISDSELLIRQMNGFYKVKDSKLKIIRTLALELLEETSFKKNSSLKFEHVVRSKNKNADSLANKAIDDKVKIPEEFLSLLSKYDITL